MHVLNTTLEKNVIEAEGRYLNSRELAPLEDYLQSYAIRLETYQSLRDQNEKLLLQTLRKLSQSHPDIIQQHGPRCKYDMSEVLRYIALSILRDDETLFTEQMMSWLDTILMAHKRNVHCATAYRYLQETITSNLSAGCCNLVRPYLDSIMQTLQSHA
ncbi:phycobilisome protein [Neosynechococcus sphagnicola sy1]|uniref:Phycobilisome protein n=1 Tax=Neosynechococcus sphagnicola sy1 TaxID=1497020 RepID=A0A098TJ21_9CYAN|nr:phycobilisome protein [Neosynechococcus sphagnicola]KGF72550.1 phycobilisome protein [Neosynechococcus sphagnicola sy1]